MVFSSLLFLFAFLPALLLIYYLVPGRQTKNIVLLLGSLAFYGWGGRKHLILMLCCIMMNYLFGIWMEKRRRDGKALKPVLILSVIGNLGILFYFKYWNFFIENINRLPGVDIKWAYVVLPIGISFFTFQAMSYVIDLYRGKVSVQRNPLKLALYIALFPQLIAGPIVRYAHVEAEIDGRKETVDDVIEGFIRFTVGLGKKVLIANYLGNIADQFFGADVNSLTTAMGWVGALCYTMQIYFDFSGYSDMAIGLGRMLGFKFPENFDHPYISKTISEFWRRWHMTLSEFFKDYVYIPMGGSREGNVYFHLFMVFFLTGIWHGANWTYFLWGIWNAFFILIERWLKSKGWLKANALTWVYTMFVVVIGMTIFRVDSLGHLRDYGMLLCGLKGGVNVHYTLGHYLDPRAVLTLILGAVLACPVLEWVKFDKFKEEHEVAYRWLALCFVMFVVIISACELAAGTYNAFIYFQF